MLKLVTIMIKLKKKIHTKIRVFVLKVLVKIEYS